MSTGGASEFDQPLAITSGDAYEPHTGRWSRLVAREFVEWLAIGMRRRWLDVGCGTGALLTAIVENANPLEVLAIDPSSTYIAYARRGIRDPRVRFEVGDARNLPVASAQVDVAAAGLLLHLFDRPDQMRVVAEMKRAVRPGGVVGAYVWDYAEGMEIRAKFWEVATAIDPRATEFDERNRYPTATLDSLHRVFDRSGLHAIEMAALEVPAFFTDLDDYWAPFLTGYSASGRYVETLDEDQREALKQAIGAALPYTDEGKIRLNVRAWAIRGVT